MLEQISRISQQIGYYLHRASMRSGNALLSRELHPIAPLLDSLTSALNKVYQRKGVNITLDISPEISFVGEQNDFMEVMGNVLDNACKYCLEFVEVSVRQTNDNQLHILVEDDGPGIPATNARRCSIAASAPIRCVRVRGRPVCRPRYRRTVRRRYPDRRQPARRRLHGSYLWPPAS